MPRTNHFVTLDDPLSQRPATMQANVVHRGDRPIHVGDANHFVATRKFLRLAFRGKFGLRGKFDEVGQGILWHPEARSLKPIFAES
jgi:urease beta subunit